MIAVSHIWLKTENLQCCYFNCHNEVTAIVNMQDNVNFMCDKHKNMAVDFATDTNEEVKYLPDCKVEISYIPEEQEH